MKRSSVSSCDTSHYPKEGPWELPEGWEWCRIGDVCTVFSARRVHQSDWKKQGIPFYRAREIVKLAEQGHVDNELFISRGLFEEFSREGLMPKAGDIMISAVGTIGRAYIVKQSDMFYFKDASVLCLKNPYLVPEYLNIYLQSSFAKLQMYSGSKGTTVDTITIEKANDYIIPIPPRNEQQRIIAFTHQIFPFLNSIEVEKHHLQGLIVKSKERILQLAINGKLVPQDPSDEPAIELLRRINPDFRPSDNLHYEGELPSGWQLCHIQDIAAAELGKTLDKGKNQGEEKPYLCALNVKWESFDFSTIKTIKIEEKEKTRYRLLPGDLLVCEGGDVGRSAIWKESVEMYYQNALHRVRFKEGISPDFYLYVLRYYKSSGVIDEICKGVTIKHFTGQVFNSIDLPVPPVAEQQRIVAKIKTLFSALEEIQAGLDA